MSEENEHGVPPDAFRKGQDVYCIYSFETVAFHWEHATGKVYRRFRGEGNESETTHSNRLFMDARMGGRLVTKEDYEKY